MASAPASSAASRARSTEAMSSGTSTEPSAFSRSVTSKRCLRSTTGLGRTKVGTKSAGILRLVRPISMRSRKPAVVRTATRAPRRSRTALVPTVVPWTTRLHVRARDAEGLEAGEDGARLLLPPRGDLGDDDAPGGLVDRGEIGERAADVDADEEHGAA